MTASESASGTQTAVLFVDIAGSTLLRSQVGDTQAAQTLSALLDRLATIIGAQGGEVLKSDGDDLLVIFQSGPDAVSAAALAAIESQIETRRQGLALYAGLAYGPLRRVEAFGRRDVDGLCVNLAARLHKLVPNQSGFIFLDATTAGLPLPPLRARCRPYGTRPLKGIGDIEVMSLDWDEARTSLVTRHEAPSRRVQRRRLLLSLGRQRHAFEPEARQISVGRSRQCELVLPSALVSGRHVELFWDSDTWSARDLSRNGTWIRSPGAGADLQLQGRVVPLAASGSLCLGQRFEHDTQYATTLEFEQEVIG